MPARNVLRHSECRNILGIRPIDETMLRMSQVDFDSIIPSMKCANCGQKFGKTFGWLKAHDHLICGCGTRTNWSPDQISEGVKRLAVARTEVIDKIRRALKR